MGHPWLLFHYFSYFPNQCNNKLMLIMSIQYIVLRNANAQASKHASPPITTGHRAPAHKEDLFIKLTVNFLANNSCSTLEEGDE